MKAFLKVFFIFSILGLLLFSNSLNHPFLMDDYVFLHNPVLSNTKFILSQWDPYREQALGVVDSHNSLDYYRPLAHMAYDFCYATFKNNYWEYHLLNLFLFVFASSLIYLLIEKLSDNFILAFLTGLLYLIHPINGIIVNYISAGVFAFQVIFMLGSILLLWLSLERNNDRPLYFLSLLFSFLSLFWHESGILTPFYLSTVILLFRKDTFKEKLFYLLPYFLIIFCYALFRFFFFRTNEIDVVQRTIFHIPWYAYLADLFQVLMWYIGKLFLPWGIVMQWSQPLMHYQLFWYAWGSVLLLLLGISLLMGFAKEKIKLFALTWFLIGFCPLCLAAFRMMESGPGIEPHWFVFSSIGFFVLAAYFLSSVLQRARNVGFVLLFTVIFALGASSRAYNEIWVDHKTYARYWIQHDPNFKLAYFYLAVAYQEEGAFKEARKYYNMALINGSSEEIDAYYNLGGIDYQLGDLKDAKLEFEKVLKINPYSAGAYNFLATIYFKQGQGERARKYFLQSLVYNPLSLEARRGLAYILLTHSDYQKAIDLCLKNLSIMPGDIDTLFFLIDVYNQKRDYINSRKYADIVIAHETDPKILVKTADVMVKEKEFDLALDSYMKAIHVAPDFKDAYLGAGTLLENLGKYDGAIRIWEIGSGIDPTDQRFKRDIAKVMKLKSK